VLRCIASVDIEADVIVAFTGAEELAGRIEMARARCVFAPRGNLSRVSNVGFAAARAPNVLLTDSDTTFERGCIALLLRSLKSVKVARARLIFETEPGFICSKAIAGARDFVNSLPFVFTPGIAVRKDLLSDIGGFLFNDPVPYAVDADLDLRIRRAGVPVAFVPEARIRHAPVLLRQDIRAALRIGMGCRVSITHWNRDGRFGSLPDNAVKAVRPRHLPDMVRRKGMAVLAYQCAWDAAYWMGYYRQKWAERNPSQTST